MKDTRAMVKQVFESDAVFPNLDRVNPRSYLQQLATLYDSDDPDWLLFNFTCYASVRLSTVFMYNAYVILCKLL